MVVTNKVVVVSNDDEQAKPVDVIDETCDHLGRRRVDPLGVVEYNDKWDVSGDTLDGCNNVGGQLGLLRFVVTAKRIDTRAGSRFDPDCRELSDDRDQF